MDVFKRKQNQSQFSMNNSLVCDPQQFTLLSIYQNNTDAKYIKVWSSIQYPYNILYDKSLLFAVE